MQQYDKLQESFQQAFKTELKELVDSLHTPPSPTIIDIPCGNGFYTELLTSKITNGGTITIVDNNPHHTNKHQHNIKAVTTDAYNTGLPPNTYDLTWCCQSLITLSDHSNLLTELHRITKPGGLIAIVETDEYHHTILPWPATLETAIMTALAESTKHKHGSPDRIAVPRSITNKMKQVGISNAKRTTIAIDRHQPFDTSTIIYLTNHLDYINDQTCSKLTTEQTQQLQDIINNIHNIQEFTCLISLHTGYK